MASIHAQKYTLILYSKVQRRACVSGTLILIERELTAAQCVRPLELLAPRPEADASPRTTVLHACPTQPHTLHGSLVGRPATQPLPILHAFGSGGGGADLGPAARGGGTADLRGSHLATATSLAHWS